MSRFVTAIVLNNDLLQSIANDREFGSKLANAAMGIMTGAEKTVSYDGKVAVTAVEMHLDDKVRLVAVGGGTGRDLGEAGPLKNMAAGSERPLLEACANNYGLVVRGEAKPREAKPKPPAKPAANTPVMESLDAAGEPSAS